ncbi:MAG: polyprenyl diphosphate synthase [Candidatus Omnitrophica bacterium]|nr:polyprenyl diphosphate synthase [Candidatus Omnitrophota bacterium]
MLSGKNIPRHIAIIMDGNGRWAARKGLPRYYGHNRGVETVRRIISACLDLGIKHLTLYTFSTENWRRPKQEVDAIMKAMEESIDRYADEFVGQAKVRVRFIGRWRELPKNLAEKMQDITIRTKDFNNLNLTFAINYGGRQEILDALTEVIARNIKVLDEESFRGYLYAPDIPDPDLLIRTAGEFRVSNFLLWQIAYSEIYTTKILWPDFKKQHLVKAIKSYQKRRRKFGAL